MLCQRCGKRSANVHYKQIVNGAVYEEYLCSECAGEKNKGFSSFDVGFDDFFGNLFAGSTSASSSLRGAKTCPLCGATLRDISSTGKLGCAKCYEVFADELKSTISGIHGNVTHIGRAPGGHREMMERQEKLEELKRRQQSAVEAQDYELAAKLRDEIKELSEGKNARSVSEGDVRKKHSDGSEGK